MNHTGLVASQSPFGLLWRLLGGNPLFLVSAVLLLLPWLLLLGFGVYQLLHVNHGLPAWILLAATLSGVAVLLLRRARRAPHPLADAQIPDPDLPQRERDAWVQIARMAQHVSRDPPSTIEQAKSRCLDLAEAVGAAIHPGKAHAAAMFTLSDVLLAVEVAVRDLRVKLVHKVPGSHVVPVSALLGLRDLRSRNANAWQMGMMIYRAGRFFANPMAATASEARDWLQGEAAASTASYVKGLVAKALVEEAGALLIELYAGRLRARRHTQPHPARSTESASDELPIRVLVAGQVNSGKSSLINGLLQRVAAKVDPLPLMGKVQEYRLQREGQPDLVFVEAPGLDGSPARLATARAEAATADVIFWVVAAHQPAREIDRSSLEQIHLVLDQRTDRAIPDVLAVVSHVDRLRPVREWNPPYDMRDGDNLKSHSISQSVQAVRDDLSLARHVVPVSLAQDLPPYNLDELWTLASQVLPAAQRKALVRLLAEQGGLDWMQVLPQLMQGGRWIFGAVARDVRNR